MTERPPKKTIRGNPKGGGTIVKGLVAPVLGARAAESGPARAERLRRITRG